MKQIAWRTEIPWGSVRVFVSGYYHQSAGGSYWTKPFENTLDLATCIVVLSVFKDLRQRKETESTTTSVNTFDVLGCG